MSLVSLDIEGRVDLDRTSKILAGVPGGIYRAVGSAVTRAAQRGRTVGMKIVSEEYAIGQNELKAQTKHINTVVKDQSGAYSVTFGYRGYVIPLIKFDTKIGSDGRVYSRILRRNARVALDHAFAARINGRTGIFERETSTRIPTRELTGPSSVQAFYTRDSTVEKMNDAVLESYEKRMDVEIARVLNGWGSK